MQKDSDYVRKQRDAEEIARLKSEDEEGQCL